jgi:dienelactone hydrolase
MARHVIYIPGLGDYRNYGQPFALNLWRVFGVKAHYLAIKWQSDESFGEKLEKILAKIDRLEKDYGSVSLVGVSAGASAVLNAYADRPNVKNVVCICGKINNPQTIGQKVYKINPPFEESVYLLQKILKKLSSPQRARILSIHPVKDIVVPPKDTLIDDAIELEVRAKSHVAGIFYSVIIKAPTICSFIKHT